MYNCLINYLESLGNEEKESAIYFCPSREDLLWTDIHVKNVDRGGALSTFMYLTPLHMVC